MSRKNTELQNIVCELYARDIIDKIHQDEIRFKSQINFHVTKTYESSRIFHISYEKIDTSSCL